MAQANGTTTAKKRERKPAKSYANPEARFSDVASQRVARAVKAIQAVGKCSGSKYASTAEQRAKAVEYLTQAVKTMSAMLESGRAAGPEIKL